MCNNSEIANAVADAFHNAAASVQESAGCATDFWVNCCRPSMMLKPRLKKDMSQWVASYGTPLRDGDNYVDDRQDIIKGFGASPDEAYRDFDKKWTEKLHD